MSDPYTGPVRSSIPLLDHSSVELAVQQMSRPILANQT
jgi:hypothetical protein